MGEQVTKVKLTPAAKRYALQLVKRRKIQDAHADCVQPGFVVLMGARVDENDNIVDRPYSSPTYEIDHHKNCRLAVLRQRNYCRHGNFVGDPYGPDYMCGWCEDGYDPSIYELALDEAREHQRRVTEGVIKAGNDALLKELNRIHRENGQTFGWVDPDVIAKMVTGVMSAAD